MSEIMDKYNATTSEMNSDKKYSTIKEKIEETMDKKAEEKCCFFFRFLSASTANNCYIPTNIVGAATKKDSEVDTVVNTSVAPDPSNSYNESSGVETDVPNSEVPKASDDIVSDEKKIDPTTLFNDVDSTIEELIDVPVETDEPTVDKSVADEPVDCRDLTLFPRDSMIAEDRWNRSLAIKLFTIKLPKLIEITKEYSWLSSFYRSDPRFQIMKCFTEVATMGSPSRDKVVCKTIFCKKVNMFTVWRPTSRESIRNMILGEGTGKGFDIKGKSAKCGNISSFVPFVQICEDQHKKQVSLKNDGIVRIYYSTEESRNEAEKTLLATKYAMRIKAKYAELKKK